MEYFVFSGTLYSFFPAGKYIREAGGMFFYFNEEDSNDCFRYRFDLPVDSFYLDCKNIPYYVLWMDTTFTFGYPDIRQYQDFISEYSKNFGLFNITIPWVATYYCTLEGCIISGTTYGNLLVDVEDEIITPIEFELSQNYPNPFNPSTKIKYQIPETEKVTLKVFDILGKEVATLVDREMRAGKYEVDLNGNSLTSGIYFYQLRTGNFVETKKMILLK